MSDELSKLASEIDDDLDLDKTYTLFRKETGEQTTDAFLTYLNRKDLIKRQTFRKVHARAEMDLSEKVPRKSGDPLRYRLLGVIAEGGMGEIHVAKDLDLRRKVAVKLLKSGEKDSKEAEMIRRFIREAQVTAQLDHPNIVPVYSLELAEGDDDTASFAMKLIHGKTLSKLADEQRARLEVSRDANSQERVELPDRLENFIKICDAIAYAHAKGVIHRDLKPSNVMVGEFGEVYVMDWGIARMARLPEDVESIDSEEKQPVAVAAGGVFDAEMTVGDAVLGTVRYMAPEQASGDRESVGEWSDQYALGLILYELVTLRRAIPGDTMVQLMENAQNGVRRPLSHAIAGVGIPYELAAIIDKSTRNDPMARYPSVEKLADDLRRFLHGEEVQAAPDNMLRSAARWMARHKLQSLVGVLLLILISAGGAIWSLVQQNRAAQQARKREVRLTRYQTAVSAHSNWINSHFQRLESLVLRLSGEAVYLVTRTEPTTRKLYTHLDFADPAKAPPDLKWSTLYRKKISLDHPVVKLAPKLKMSQVEDKLKRLVRLQYHYRRAFLDSRMNPTPLDDKQIRKLLTRRGVTIRWAYVGLKVGNSGVMFSYPGKAAYPPEYDPTVRPWYKLGQNQRGARWGNPYIDLQGQGLVLPCVAALWDGMRFLGVAGIEITFDDIIRAFLKRPAARGVIESYLVDTRGRIVVRSTQLAKKFEGGKLHRALELKRFPVDEVYREILGKESGMSERDGADGRRVIAYYRLPTLGWYYIEEVRLSTLLGD